MNIIDKYFDFEKCWEEVSKDLLTNNYIEDADIELFNITKIQVMAFIKAPTISMFLEECYIESNAGINHIRFHFAEEYDNSTEAGTDISFYSITFYYDFINEVFTEIEEEQG